MCFEKAGNILQTLVAQREERVHQEDHQGDAGGNHGRPVSEFVGVYVIHSGAEDTEASHGCPRMFFGMAALSNASICVSSSPAKRVQVIALVWYRPSS